MNKFENSKKKLITLLNVTNVNNLNKEVLIELIRLFDTISEKEFFENLINYLNLISDKNKNFINAEARINALLKKLTEKRYKQKIENNDYILYEYDNRFDIYFLNTINFKNLYEFLIKNQFKSLEIYYKDKSKFLALFFIYNLTTDSILSNFNTFENKCLTLKLNEYDPKKLKITL
jgi:hypothetical protein